MGHLHEMTAEYLLVRRRGGIFVKGEELQGRCIAQFWESVVLVSSDIIQQLASGSVAKYSHSLLNLTVDVLLANCLIIFSTTLLFQNLWIGQVARKNKQIKLIK